MDETAEIDRAISEGNETVESLSSKCSIKLLNTTQYVSGSKSIAATSGVVEDDLEDLEKELEDLMMDNSIPGIFDAKGNQLFITAVAGEQGVSHSHSTQH